MAYSCGEGRTNSVGHEAPGFLRPSIAALRKTDLFISERLAVGFSSVLLMR